MGVLCVCNVPHTHSMLFLIQLYEMYWVVSVQEQRIKEDGMYFNYVDAPSNDQLIAIKYALANICAMFLLFSYICNTLE